MSTSSPEVKTPNAPTVFPSLGVGLHYNVPASVYHSDPAETPSLSSGVARTMAEQSPAHAFLEHVRLGGHKIEPTAEMILGGYVHGLLAGDTSDYAVGNFDNYTTKAAREWRDATTESGKVPILEKTVDRAHLIEKALRAKAALGLTTDPFTTGKPEVTAIWQDEGFWFRARYDRLILDPTFFGDVWDWKTTSSVTPDAITRAIIDHGYHVQAAHYLWGLRKLAPQFAGRLTFTLVFVETEAPFAVRRVPICESFLQLGDMILRRAVARWKECMTSGQWPDDSGESLMLTPPAWYAAKLTEGGIAA